MRPGHVIVAAVLALLTLGVVMVSSAGMNIEPSQPITLQSILLSRLTVYLGLALLTLGLAYHWAPRVRMAQWAERTGEAGGIGNGWSLGGLWVGVGVLILAMLLVYVPGLGAVKNGAHRWLAIPLPGLKELSVQPSEIAKWGMVFLIAWYAVRLAAAGAPGGAANAPAAGSGAGVGRFFGGLLPALFAVGLVAGVMVLEDLGTAVLLISVSCVLLIAAGARVWHFLALAPMPVLGLVGAVIMHPYRMERIRSFLDPYADPDGKGYHMIQSMIAVANGQVTGRGLGHGLQKFGYLPEDTTDFIFAIICEELGVFGSVLVVGLYGVLAWAGIAIVRAERSPFLKLVGLGIIATIGFQALINLAVVTAMGPTKGIALPLLSSGGTGWIMTAACLGFLAGMDRGTEGAKEAAEPESVGGVAPLPAGL